jgi:hypothetical protein
MGGDVHALAVESGACFEATLPACAAPEGAAQDVEPQTTGTAPVSTASPA